MAVSNTHNPQNGFCSKTLIFRSIRPPSQLPPQSTHLSVTDFVFSLLDTNAGAAATASLIDATTRHFIPYSDVKFFVRNLSAAIRQPPVSLSHGDCAFVISHNSSYLPILYLSLFSVGVIVSTANPAGSIHEISRQIQICKPAVVFATAEALQKLSDVRFYNRIVLIDSNEFESMMRVESNGNDAQINVSQSDTAVILYSSGTTGKMKGVKLTHRNLMSSVAGAITRRETRPSPAVFLCTVPYFHVYGFTLCIRMVACGESLVSIAKYDLRLMIMSIKAFGVRYLALAPPVVAALVDQNNEELNGSNWSSLEAVFSGGAPLTVAVIRKFKRRFPNVSLVQTYGLTETTGAISRVASLYESTIVGTVGRLIAHCEAKIVDPNTGVSLPPMNHGELWVRGPSIMKGYVDDKQGIINTVVDSDGWLRTGDLCFFDNEGFLFVVDRLKELIKYKGYQPVGTSNRIGTNFAFASGHCRSSCDSVS